MSIDTGHSDLIHDAQLDYYGRRIASASSDGTIRIFSLNQPSTSPSTTSASTHTTGNTNNPTSSSASSSASASSSSSPSSTLVATLTGHGGPVWQICWAHPKYGSLIASASYDRTVRLWKEEATGVWRNIYTHAVHELSVNSIDFVHPDFGLALGAASSDGNVSILTCSPQTGTWSSSSFVAHQIGVNAISFAPPSVGGWLGTDSAADTAAPPRLRFATGGCDNLVKIWVQTASGSYECEAELSFHKDWVRDVAWSPSVGLPGTALASGSQDGVVAVWSEDAKKRGAAAFLPTQLPKFPGTVWRTTWSPTGNVLAVSSGDNKVSLWKETADGSFECASTVDPAAPAAAGAGGAGPAAAPAVAQPTAA